MEKTGRNEPAMARWLPHLAILAGVLMVLQAFLAGRGLFFNRDLIEIHGYVGEFTFLVGVAIVISAWLGKKSGRYGQTELYLAGTNMILIVAQLALLQHAGQRGSRGLASCERRARLRHHRRLDRP